MGVSAPSAHLSASQCPIAQKVVSHGIAMSLQDAVLQFALGETNLILPSNTLASNTHISLTCLPTDLAR